MSPSATAPRLASVEPEQLRGAASTFLTGVTVITSAPDGVPAGCTANAVTSLSLRPPLMLVCLDRDAGTRAAVITAGSFAINVLPADPQGERLCRVFAHPGYDRFRAVRNRPGRTGAPLLLDALSWLECELVEAFDCGDHTICAGRVVATAIRSGRPLAFYRGRLFAPCAAPLEAPGTNGDEHFPGGGLPFSLLAL